MLKVIIADDEKKICQLLQVLVDWEALGFEIIAVKHDGNELLQAVRELLPDVVVTDIRMPGCSGLELLHCIRQENLDIEVLIMSGYRQFDYARDALRDGAVDYLLKPLSRSAIQEALKGIRARRESVQREQQHMEQMKESLEQYSRKMREKLIDMIRSGERKKATIDELNREYQCGFVYSGLYFAVIKIDLIDIVHKKTEEVLAQKFQNIIAEEMKQRSIPCVRAMHQNCTYILMNAENMETLEGALYHLIYEIKDFMARLDIGHVTVGMAEVKENNLYQALTQSVSAVMDQIYRGIDRILYYQECSGMVDPSVMINRQSSSNLNQALTSRSEANLNAVVGSILRSIQVENKPLQSGESVFQCIMALQKQLMNSCRYLYADEAINSLLVKYQNLLYCCSDWSSYERLLQMQNEELIALIEQQQSKKEKKPVRQMKQMIEELYQRPLTLDDIAEELGMSSAYVSKLFKKELGVTFSRYLNSVRLEKAKKLLATTNECAANIAAEVGYNDEKYFLRLFKKEVGLTTSEYRRLYGE